MAKKAEAVENPTVAARARRPRLARLTVLACALLAPLCLSACSLFPPEHASNLTPAERLMLINREPYRLTFKYDAYFKAGTTSSGVALWLGDKEHIVMALPSARGTTVVEYTPGGLYWVGEYTPEGVFASPARMSVGPILLSDFTFRAGPLVPGVDGRIAIGDGARPGQPKVTIYLSTADFEPSIR